MVLLEKRYNVDCEIHESFTTFKTALSYHCFYRTLCSTHVLIPLKKVTRLVLAPWQDWVNCTALWVDRHPAGTVPPQAFLSLSWQWIPRSDQETRNAGGGITLRHLTDVPVSPPSSQTGAWIEWIYSFISKEALRQEILSKSALGLDAVFHLLFILVRMKKQQQNRRKRMEKEENSYLGANHSNGPSAWCCWRLQVQKKKQNGKPMFWEDSSRYMGVVKKAREIVMNKADTKDSKDCFRELRWVKMRIIYLEQLQRKEAEPAVVV